MSVLVDVLTPLFFQGRLTKHTSSLSEMTRRKPVHFSSRSNGNTLFEWRCMQDWGERTEYFTPDYIYTYTVTNPQLVLFSPFSKSPP